METSLVLLGIACILTIVTIPLTMVSFEGGLLTSTLSAVNYGVFAFWPLVI